MKKGVVSVVIPVMNEEESLPELYSQIKESFDEVKLDREIIFIDDGSTDSSLEIIKDLESKDKSIRVVSFRRNLGKSPALMAGFARAAGEFTLMMDADLQDDPRNLPKLIEALEEKKLDMITGWRKDRKDKGFMVAPSKLFNWLVGIMFGMKVHDLNSGLKLYRTEVVKDLNIYGGMHRFIPVLAAQMGYKTAELPVIHHPRKYGKSKYGFSKIFTDLPDLFTIFFITKFNRRPLHFFGRIGGIFATIGFIILFYLTLVKLIGHEAIGDRPLLLLGILLVILGFQTVFTGLLADLFVNLNSRDKTYPIKYESA